MNLEQRIVLLAQAVGADVKTLRTTVGTLANLTTLSKADIVSALNEVVGKETANANAIGTLANLGTTAKGNLVVALNEVNTAVHSIDLTSLINDAALAGVVNKTYSADKIISMVAAATAAIVDSSPSALDTLKELATALGNDPSFATTIATSMGNRVRVDGVQTFTSVQQDQGRSNISAASVASVTAAQAAADSAALTASNTNIALGNTDRDLSLAYAAAKV